jgi:hypothetical protein
MRKDKIVAFLFIAILYYSFTAEDSGLRYIYTTIHLQTIRDIEKQCIILFQEQGFINVCIEFFF